MNTNKNRRSPRKWTIAAFIALTVLGVSWTLFNESSSLRAQSPADPHPRINQGVFTTAHSGPGQAIRHFFGIRPEAVQPVAYQHRPHIEKAQLKCVFCHEGVETGPVASIPNVSKCMSCHEEVATDKPVIKEITAYRDRGEDIPWQRVYGWVEEAHVRFNHSPHIRAGVQCSTCHGDVASMTVARRVVDHTMGFCIKCHQENKVSNDCLTCHY
jgi:hypothetical protein